MKEITLIQINNYILKLIGEKIINEWFLKNISYEDMKKSFLKEIEVEDGDYEARFMFTDILYQHIVEKNEN